MAVERRGDYRVTVVCTRCTRGTVVHSHVPNPTKTNLQCHVCLQQMEVRGPAFEVAKILR